MLKRRIEVGQGTCLLGYSGRSYIKSHAFDASTLAAVGGVSEVQTATLTGTPSGGTFTLKYRGQETAATAYNATAATLQTNLRALAGIGSAGVTVSGSAGGPYTITFAGQLANTDVYNLQPGTISLTGGSSPSVTIAQTTTGVTYDPRFLLGTADLPGVLVSQSTVNLPTGGTAKKIHEYTAAGGVPEVQSLAITGAPTGGSFTLNYNGSETAAIAYNANAAAVQTALNNADALSEDGGVTCSGGALPGSAVTITFNRKGARNNITVASSALTGGTAPAAAVTETTPGADAEAIFGITDGVEEFMINTSDGDRQITVYRNYLNIDVSKLKNYATYQAEVTTWAAATFSTLETL